MPLSEDEEQILADIERRLTEDDPKFADAVSNSSLGDHLAHRLRWSILGFIAGFLMLLCFFISVWIAAVGFAIMVACAFIFYLAMKQLGREQLRVLGASGGLTGMIARLSRREFDNERVDPPADPDA